MKITIISGSHRANSQSSKISKYFRDQLIEQGYCDEAYIFDLAQNPLPLWEEEIWQGESLWKQRLAPISEQLIESDAFIIICPEWHGMVPAGLKNFFLMWGKGELAHKPALLVGISSSDGGSYPLAELRMSSYKNNRICYLPEHLIIRNVESVFNSDPADNNASSQLYFEKRSDYCLRLLNNYASAFRVIRSSDACDLSTYKSGM